MTEDDDFRDVDLLSHLRARFGHHLVDRLFECGRLSSSPLTPAIRQFAQELASWTPSIVEHSSFEASRPTRLTHRQLLSDNLPDLGSAFYEDGSDAETTIDAVVQLRQLARRAYPAYLAAPERERSWSPISLRHLPEYSAACSALREDERTHSLLEIEEVETSSGSDNLWIRVLGVVDVILYGAWRLALLRGDWTCSGFCTSVEEQYRRVVSACEGKLVDVPIFMGFGEMRIEEDAVHESVRVRPYRGGLQSSLLGESDHLDQQGGGIVAERSSPWAFRALRAGQRVAGSIEKPSDGFNSASNDQLRYWAECLSVSIAFSQAPASLRMHQLKQPSSFSPAPQLRWMLVGDPFYGAKSWHFSQGWTDKTGPATSLTTAMLERTRMLTAIQDTPTRIAISRLSSGLRRPRRWMDSLLDAVIAWEALSGHCLEATTLKVTAIISHFVSDGPHRRQMRQALRGVYKTRSGLVHGGSPEVTSQHRDAALLVGVVALRALVEKYPSLIGDPNRFETLFLDSGR